MVLTLHDLDGSVVYQVRGGGDYALAEGPGAGEPTYRPNAASNLYGAAYNPLSANNTLALPGPPLDMVSRIDSAGNAILYTLHVDYNQTFPTQSNPTTVPYVSGEPYQAPGIANPQYNTTRVMKWQIDPDPPAGDPPIKLISELYINDPQYTFDPTDPGAGGNASIWCWDPGGVEWANQPPPLSGYPDDAMQYDWPAGLHDLSVTDDGGAQGLLLVFSSTRSVTLNFELDVPTPLAWSDPFWPDGGFCRLKITRMTSLEPEPLTDQNFDIFPRYSTPDSTANGPTMQLSRGAWAGSFLCPDGDGNWWIGVQTITDQFNVPPGTAQNSPGGPFGLDRLAPQSVSASVVHALVNVPAFAPLVGVTTVLASEGTLPGACIASHALFIPGVGPTVGLHACAPGDDRTGLQEISQQARSDVLSATSFLATRRTLPTPRLASGAADEASFTYVPPNYPTFSAYNTMVAVAIQRSPLTTRWWQSLRRSRLVKL